MKPVPLPLFKIGEPTSPKPTGWPFLRLGFRPFYVGGALLAALIVPLWVLFFLGQMPLAPVLPPLLWHAHEMLFGFAAAIIVGFLLTAGKAWTGLGTPRGLGLGLLAALWLAARVAAMVAPGPVYALLDIALLPCVAVVLVRLLLRSRNYRNLPLALILSLLAAANITFHLAALGVLALPAMAALYAGLALITLIECVMAGRVIPGFTMSATPGLKLATPQWQERLTMGLTALGLALWVASVSGGVTAVVLLAASVLHAKRLWGWQPWITRTRPILWVLHAAYAWIPMGLALLGLAQWGWVPVSAGVHALAVGATGGLIIGMVTRTARGHTGRQLVVSGAETGAYALVMAAAVLRVLVPLIFPSLYSLALAGAALAWSVAFVIYLWIYTPWLVRTRLDGKDG